MTNLPSENATFSRHWWIHLCRWLWVRQGFVWGTIILGLVINVGAAWLTSKTSIFAGTPLGWFMRWVVEHSLAAAIIGLSLVLLIILVGVVSRLEVARVSIVETPEQQNRSR